MPVLATDTHGRLVAGRKGPGQVSERPIGLQISYNTNIKLIKRSARGFRSQANYHRRILLANAATAE